MSPLRAIEEWTGHKQPPDPMKTSRSIAVLVIAAACFAWVMCSCATETTRPITTDKNGTVTDTTVVKKGTDPAAMELVKVAAEIYRPRPAMIVREEKSDHDMKRLLQGRPITELEIAFRYRKP